MKAIQVVIVSLLVLILGVLVAFLVLYLLDGDDDKAAADKTLTPPPVPTMAALTTVPPTKATAAPSLRVTDSPSGSPVEESSTMPFEDPFAGTVGSDYLYLWNTNGAPLTLPVKNALSDHWQPFFEKSIADWSINGTVAFTISNVPDEPECKAEDGFVKICNADYGETNWRGIAKLLVRNGYLTSASIRMNDIYVVNTTEAKEWQAYTMCRQLGLVLGLPNIDEDFDNEDMGSCLDYTLNPGSNDLPGTKSIEKLIALYGNATPTMSPTIVSTPYNSFEGSFDPDKVYRWRTEGSQD